jgi:uncharacterized membrane protein
MMYGYGTGPQDWLFMLAMMTVMTVMTVLTVVAVVAIVRGLRTSGGRFRDARLALDQRYARGEVSTEVPRANRAAVQAVIRCTRQGCRR